MEALCNHYLFFFFFCHKSKFKMYLLFTLKFYCSKGTPQKDFNGVAHQNQKTTEFQEFNNGDVRLFENIVFFYVWY